MWACIGAVQLHDNAGAEATSMLLLEALEVLGSFGLPVFATDGGSSGDFVASARTLRGIHFCDGVARGLWPQTRASLHAALASGAQYVLYTEPDKVQFFRTNLAAVLNEAELDERTGVLVVARAPHVLRTFPDFQQYTESVINRCCAEVIGAELDYSYGPFVLRSSLIAHVAPPSDDIGWGWRPYAFATAHRQGFSVRQTLQAAGCPPEQRHDSEHIHRMEQLAQSVRGLAAAARQRA